MIQVCRGRKQTLDEYATKQCSQWSHSLATVTLTGEGRRFKQEPSIGSWISCAIFCRTDKDQWYSPRRELGSQSYYPDGIWYAYNTLLLLCKNTRNGSKNNS